MNRRQARKPKPQDLAYYTCPSKPRPVHQFTEQQLHQMLVEDAVKRHETDPIWFVAAIMRIGVLSGLGKEAAFQRVIDEVEELTGSRMMPGAPGWVG